MNANTYNRLLGWVNDTYPDYYMSYTTINDTWQRALYYNRVQNDLIKNEEPFDVVHVLNLLNETSEQVEPYTIKANKAYNRKQWFILLVGSDMYTNSAQALRKIIESV